jgi:tetratricopeptide (TPR) repeat protein
MDKGEFSAARDLAVELIAQEGPGSSPTYGARLRHLVGIAENRLGRYEQSSDALRRGLELCVGQEGTVPELTIALLEELAAAHSNLGDLNEADRALRRASQLAADYLPPGHVRLAAIQHALGTLYWSRGQLSRAEHAFRISLKMIERTAGPDHADAAAAAMSLGGLLSSTGRGTAAVPLLKRSLSTFERVYGPVHPDTISAAYALAVVLGESQPAPAETLLGEAMANWRRSQPERHPHMIKFLSALARLRCIRRAFDEAAFLSRQALQLSIDLFGAEHSHAVAQMYEHALLLKDAGKRREAAAVKKEADRIRAVKGYTEQDRLQVDILALR